jgi:hypothetical protein
MRVRRGFFGFRIKIALIPFYSQAKQCDDVKLAFRLKLLAWDLSFATIPATVVLVSTKCVHRLA